MNCSAVSAICESGTQNQTRSESSRAVLAPEALACTFLARLFALASDLAVGRATFSSIAYPDRCRCKASAEPNRPGPTIAIDGWFTRGA